MVSLLLVAMALTMETMEELLDHKVEGFNLDETSPEQVDPS